jgi:SAM-dependent methyltransferase
MSVARKSDPEPDTEPTTEPEAGYDRMAEAYAQHWGPVIRPAAERVLDLLELALDDGRAARVLDVGTGTGTLAIRALERWPAIHVTGIDPSRGMLEEAERAAERRLATARRRQFLRAVAPADELPYEDGSFDVAMSSFVLQLVPSRAAALREIRRVLRPGGPLAWVVWQRSDRSFAPDKAANEVLDEAGFDPPEPDSRPGDVASPAAAATAMRRAGFKDVVAIVGEVAHAWDVDGYLAFFTQFDEESLFDELDPAERGDIEGRIRERLERLTPDELTLRLPVIYTIGHRPG